MELESCGTLDPRIRRTRQVLQQALEKLMLTKEFEQISVNDITEAASVNRATFYDHYADKFALLQCVVGSQFHNLTAERQVQFDGTCVSALKTMALAACEFLTKLQGPDGKRELKPHMECAVVAVLRRILLEGLTLHPPKNGVSAEMVAAAASWAIYGAAKEWAQTPERQPVEEVAETIMILVSPVLHAA